MVSFSIVFRFGARPFCDVLRQSGFDGVIIPDLPPPEAESVCATVQAAGLQTCLLVAPTTTAPRRSEIARLSSGFVYYLSISGITGERNELPPELSDGLKQMKSVTDAPICVGFGISKPEHVKQLRGLADGAIVGSGVVRQMQAHAGEGPDGIATSVTRYCQSLLSRVR